MFDFKRVSGRANTYTITDEHSGLCLDVSGAFTADGAAVIQWTCNGQTNQQFTLNPLTALGNSQDFQLVAVHSGKCVDVTGVSTSPGTLIHQWTCDPASTLKDSVGNLEPQGHFPWRHQSGRGRSWASRYCWKAVGGRGR